MDQTPIERTKTVKCLEESIWRNLHDPGLGNAFLTMTSKAKEKNREIGLHRNEKLLCIKRHYQQNEKANHRIRENICKSCNLIRDKYPEPIFQNLQLYNKQQPYLKMGKGLN